MVAVLLLSRETHTAITLGFGAYVALFTPRRKAGVIVMAISVAYAMLCAAVIIPWFAKSGRYERLDIFGALGGSIGELALAAFTKPELFFGRLFRSQSINFVLLLLTTMCFLPLGGWRLAISALPALLVHLLMENTEWIGIKFWHHAMVLPILSFAALSCLTPVRESHSLLGMQGQGRKGGFPNTGRIQGRNLGIALALFTCAGWSHYFFGFSPLAKAYEPYAADAFLQSPDPRLALIRQLRQDIPRDRTILATERLAAHFTDYKRIYTGRRPLPSNLVILDRSDAWDTSGLPQRAAEFAANPDYQVYAESGPIIVYTRRSGAAPPPSDP
jgi:hypothetical protein